MRLSNNLDLPILPAWQARSFWAMALAFAVTLANAFGVDLMAIATEIGAGATPDEVIAAGERAVSAWQSIVPLVFGIWAWIERRAPNFRLAFWRSPATDSKDDDAFRFVGMVMLAGLLLFARAPAAQAQATCLPALQMVSVLAERHDEHRIAQALISGGEPIVIFANPDTGTWTIATLTGANLCLLASGEHWTEIPRPPEGGTD